LTGRQPPALNYAFTLHFLNKCWGFTLQLPAVAASLMACTVLTALAVSGHLNPTMAALPGSVLSAQKWLHVTA
jgi:hypothetical protein